MQINWILFFFLIIICSSVANKHHQHKYSCPVLRKCPTHKHKICGSDGKLYNSHCNLRKVACESGLPLRAVHPDECESKDDKIGTNENEECDPKDYDLMKEQLLTKTKDLSLLFTQLDENSDGSININELWKKSTIYKSKSGSPCILTDLLLHEDKNHDDYLDFTEFQNAFNNLYTITMVTLDQSLAVNAIQAHIGDNVEIRCDIIGKPQQPLIKWFRHNIDLTTLNIPNLKVFSDGSLYLTNVQLSFTGNYTCQAENNPVIKQIHILHVIVPPVVHVTPHFQWSAPGGLITLDCTYESLEDNLKLTWYKNDEPITINERTTVMHNGTRIQIGDLGRSDTGAYACHVQNMDDSSHSQDIASILVQDESIGTAYSDHDKQRLWVFHGNGVSIYSEGCAGLLHEMDARDIIPQNGLALCGGSDAEPNVFCEWSENAVISSDLKIYIGQPKLNRITVFNSVQMNVIQVIATDPRPKQLMLVKSQIEERIWVLCHGQLEGEHNKHHDDKIRNSFGNYEEERQKGNFEFEWNMPSREQQRHNRKTVQIIRISPNVRSQNVIHLQPIDGHFDLVYDLFVPKPSPVQNPHFHNNNRFAYVTHWDERALVKIDMEQFKYIQTISLAECQPINVVFTEYGLLIIQCQTPVTHQLNGQLVIDQITNAIITYNEHVKAHRSYLSPNQHFLVNVFHNASSSSPISTTIIVQRVTAQGAHFLYDVRTTLHIVNCDFVWKNDNYDAILASGTSNREDLLYLSLVDGRVELISGIGRPTKGSHRGMALSNKSRLGAITSLESVFIVDLNTNRVQCETQQRHQQPTTLIWT